MIWGASAALRGGGFLDEVEIAVRFLKTDAFSRTSGSWVGAFIAFRVEMPAMEEVILNELEVGVKAEGLVIDVTAPGIGADYDAGHTCAGAKYKEVRKVMRFP